MLSKLCLQMWLIVLMIQLQLCVILLINVVHIDLRPKPQLLLWDLQKQSFESWRAEKGGKGAATGGNPVCLLKWCNLSYVPQLSVFLLSPFGLEKLFSPPETEPGTLRQHWLWHEGRDLRSYGTFKEVSFFHCLHSDRHKITLGTRICSRSALCPSMSLCATEVRSQMPAEARAEDELIV